MSKIIVELDHTPGIAVGKDHNFTVKKVTDDVGNDLTPKINTKKVYGDVREVAADLECDPDIIESIE